MANIRNVAKLAGVSTGTVSNVLSGKRPVSDEVRQRVLQAIEELDYQPNMIASSLVTGQTKTIGAVMADYQLGLGTLLAGMDSEAREAGFSLLISRIGDEEDPAKHLHILAGRRVDGVIWVVPETDYSFRWWETTALEIDLPIVFAFSAPHSDHSSVSIDNFSGGYAATRHLLDHGCRKIAHISGPKDSLEARARQAGWEKALKEEGLVPEMVCGDDWSEVLAEECFTRMLEKWPDIDGVFAVSDNCALAVMKVIRKNGLRIPEDVKIIGFDDIRNLEFVNPPLTTVRQDYFMMGQHAAKEILRRVQEPDSNPKIEIFTPQLIVRRSCGCEYE